MLRLMFMRSCAIVAGLSIAAATQTAYGIANQHLNPHSDAPAEISWPNPAPGDPDHANHFHLELRPGETITQTTVLTSNQGWEAFSVWDDRFYRYADADNNFTNDLSNSFAHGYVDPTFAPRYRFVDVPNDAKGVIGETFGAWNTAAKNASAGKTTPNGTPVTTSIAANNNDASYEFTISFVEGFQETPHNAFAEWLVSETQRNVGDPSVMTLVYEATPTNRITINQANWQITQDGVNWGTTVTREVGWSFDKTPAGTNVDIDYQFWDGAQWNFWEGNEANFGALGLTFNTNTFATFGAADIVPFFEMDLFTIALHETGHVLGLLHTNEVGNIMRETIAFNAGFGNTLQAIDANSAYGAALLYSIPIPEPAMPAMIALAGALYRRRR